MTMRLFESNRNFICMDFLYFNFLGLPKELESLRLKKKLYGDIEWYSTLVVLGNRTEIKQININKIPPIHLHLHFYF
jgi:hypothetical protein